MTEVAGATVPPSTLFPPGIQFPSDTGLRGIHVEDFPRDPRHQFNFTASGILGSIQMAAGVSAMVLMFASFAARAELYSLAYGIWCGIPFLFAGFFGLVLAIKKTYNTRIMTVFVICSCVAAVFSVLSVSISCAALYRAKRVYVQRVTSDVGERLIIHSLHLLVGLVEGVMCIGSIYICAKFLAGQNHSAGNSYGVLEESAHYQSPSPLHSNVSVQDPSGQVVFLTLPSELCPSASSHGSKSSNASA